MSDLVKVIVFSFSAVIYLFILSKLLGKKQVAQLTFVDYVIGISLGSIAAEMATETETPFYYYLIAMFAFFIVAVLISYIGRLNPFLKHLLKGRPNTLIYDGKIQFNQLQKCHLDVNDLLALCREQGYFDINDVAYAVFETSGQLSVMPIGREKPVVVNDLDLKIEQASLTDYLIVDGRISFSGLNEINKDVAWLYKNLNINCRTDLKEIILASYDSELKKFDVHYKHTKNNKNLKQVLDNKEQRQQQKQLEQHAKLNATDNRNSKQQMHEKLKQMHNSKKNK